MSIALPKNSAKMKDWSWDNYVPFFDYLEDLDLSSSNVDEWMRYNR